MNIKHEKSWHNLYKRGWGQDIVPEAYGHPAKVARGLARRIYAHAIERGYLKPGDTCLDPFAGIGGFALDALANGLNFVGVELEQSFVDMGAGCDCTGISKADWVACFGRWKRFAHEGGRHWCPRCLAEAGLVLEDWEPALPGMEAPTTSYKRSSGRIPYTRPHRYAGNLDLFARHARGGATAVLVQGDSRRLCEVLDGARAEGIISSPPYGDFKLGSTSVEHPNAAEHGHYKGQPGSDGFKDYGTDARNLGNMPTGEPPSAIVSSPPYATQTVHDRCDIDPKQLTGNPPGPHSQAFTMANYGDSEGQLGAMREGQAPQAVIASPPYASSDRSDPVADHGRQIVRKDAEKITGYGSTDGQLAAMREGDVDAVIASPPHATSEVVQSYGRSWRVELSETEGSWRNVGSRYGDQDGQLAALPEGEPPAGIVQVDACVSSPPFERSQKAQDIDFFCKVQRKYRPMSGGDHPSSKGVYASSDDNLGNQQGDTFWSAARAILQQCHAVLAPGGVAIFVTKRFVRDKAIVEFSQQWADLCQSCGFELIEWIRAWLVEERGTQYDLEGEAHTKTVKRFSFFRRLHAQKFPHLAIEWEDVLIFRKARGGAS